MIAKGTTHRDGAILARYFVTGKERERAELWQLRGFACTGIVPAFRSVHVMAAATKCAAPFFHVSVRMREEETLDRSQWEYAANCIERMLGFTDQPRAIAFHTAEDTGHSHMHIAWSRIDQETFTAKPLPFWKQRLKNVSRDLEKHFGLMPVRNERESAIRFAPTRAEEEQARRLGLDVHATREIIRGCFERSDCGRSFQRALADQGLILARGDRRDFLAIDRAGGMHALGKRILGVHAAEIHARFSDLSRDQLPTVEEARQSLRSMQAPKVLMAVELAPEPTIRPADEDAVRLADGDTDRSAQSREEAVSDRIQPTACEDQVQGPIPTAVDAPASTNEATQSNAQSRGFAAILKRQFRLAVRALFKRTPSPQPQPRRRRSGEAVGSFRLAARNLLRPIIRLPVVSRTVGYLQDALPWLHLWDWNETADHDSGGEASVRDDNHLSPHP
jgi:hypothetical protein